MQNKKDAEYQCFMIIYNFVKYIANRLIIWRSLVQAQAGPRFYYSDLRFGVGRCFWFLHKQTDRVRCIYAVIFSETPHHSIRCYIVSCFNELLKNLLILINFSSKHDTLSCKSFTFAMSILIPKAPTGRGRADIYI